MQDRTWSAAACVGDSLCVRVQGDELRRRIGEGKPEQMLVEMLAPYLRDDVVLPVVFAGRDPLRLTTVPAVPPATLMPLPDIDPRIVLLGLDGLAQTRPADILGGEVTQLAGFAATYPEWDGVLCLMGPSSKWVHISAGEVVSFQSFMTGEVFAMLAGHSVLRKALEGDGWDDAAFAEALSDAMSRPERVAGQLFSLHASERLAGHDPATARARLSGMLTGMEMAAARPYWLGRDVAVIGDGAQYEAALRAQGVPVEVHDAVALAFRGLELAYAAQGER